MKNSLNSAPDPERRKKETTRRGFLTGMAAAGALAYVAGAGGPVLRKPVERQEPTILKSPFHTPTLEAFAKAFPERKESLEGVLNEIDRQSIGNFDVFQSKSKEYPGVSFSFTTLKITPDVIARLRRSMPVSAAKHSAQEEVSVDEVADGVSGRQISTGKRQQDFFLFSAFDFPPGGHAFASEDMGIDRFIRALPLVANPLRRGQEPPEVTMYWFGAPSGFGGSVTPEWVEAIKKNGLQEEAKLYAEFIASREKGGEGDRRIVLQGVSKGAIVAERTRAFLPEKLRPSVQCLLDNPVGDHKPAFSGELEGWQIVAGLFGELGARMGLEAIQGEGILKNLETHGAHFVDGLAKKTGIEKDAGEQIPLKQKAAWAELGALLRGTELDTENTRSYIRRGTHDPLSFSLQRFVETVMKDRPTIAAPILKKGKSLEVPFKGSHLFPYNRYRRWANVLDFVKDSPSTGS